MVKTMMCPASNNSSSNSNTSVVLPVISAMTDPVIIASRIKAASAENPSMREGDVWYLVSEKWYRSLVGYIERRSGSVCPGPIINTTDVIEEPIFHASEPAPIGNGSTAPEAPSMESLSSSSVVIVNTPADSMNCPCSSANNSTASSLSSRSGPLVFSEPCSPSRTNSTMTTKSGSDGLFFDAVVVGGRDNAVKGCGDEPVEVDLVDLSAGQKRLGNTITKNKAITNLSMKASVSLRVDLSPDVALLSQRLRPGISEGPDYRFVNQATWDVLAGTFGYDVAVPRRCAKISESSKVVCVELFPLELGVVFFDNGQAVDVGKVRISQRASLAQFREWALSARREFVGRSEVDSETNARDFRLWRFLLDEELIDWEGSLNRNKIGRNDKILVAPKKYEKDEIYETLNRKHLFEAERGNAAAAVTSDTALRTTPTSTSLAQHNPTGSTLIQPPHAVGPLDVKSNPFATQDTSSSNGPLRKKRRGLGNLGNTCFMNSTLQCLAHTDALRDYFRSGLYMADLNRENPLGTGGQLATEFANLMKQMWGDDNESRTSGHYVHSNVVYPRQFKYALGIHAERFMGYDQQDSQELATYLLDALHEDTNRVRSKPYTENPEQKEGESDDDAARKAWNVRRLREDSKIMDHFMGQYKSVVTCPVVGCGRVSTTFDPYVYLSVPIPGSTDRIIKFTYVPVEGVIMKMEVEMHTNSTVQELQAKIADVVGWKKEDICLVDMWSYELHSFLKPKDFIDRIRESDDIYAFQLEPLDVALTSVTEVRDDSVDESFMSNEDIEDFDWELSLKAFMKSPVLLTNLMNASGTTHDESKFQHID
uniref:ubiquitinyl hydrolase 1 n=1 Tax=Corethron hystrix TaxID=216773 RepID=A0A6U5E0P8_9STRA|mmetsp:Transcript_14976/g.33385  ORF Transcript_14976/g.33385 Transcript_14976/m.33385 type:complete len:823 (+) Transcript_14976:208-2676(+)